MPWVCMAFGELKGVQHGEPCHVAVPAKVSGLALLNVYQERQLHSRRLFIPL